jgi:transposase InsO family protein
MEYIGLFKVAHTDFTELPFANGTRKAYLIPIIGHSCKMVYGWAVGESDNTVLALQAWERARETFQELDIPYVGMIIHHDQDAVFTSYEWTGQLLLKDGVRLSYALGGAKDNPEMESFIGRFKEENQ